MDSTNGAAAGRRSDEPWLLTRGTYHHWLAAHRHGGADLSWNARAHIFAHWNAADAYRLVYPGSNPANEYTLGHPAIDTPAGFIYPGSHCHGDALG